jgi:putative ABC transport system permease protein
MSILTSLLARFVPRLQRAEKYERRSEPKGTPVNSLRRGVRNAFRNTMRSVGVVVILAVAIALSISMLIARSAVESKISSVRSSTGTTITVSPAGAFGFAGNGTPLKASKVNALLDLKNVVSLQESLSEQLSSTKTSLSAPTFGGGAGGTTGGFGGSGTFTPSIRVIGTNDPGNAVVGGFNGGGAEKLTSGTAFSPTSSADVAVIGNTLATDNKLKVGSTFTAYGTTITVVGIYTSGSTFADSDVLMPLATLQRLASASGEVSTAIVTVNNIDNVSSVTKAIQAQLGSKATVTSTEATVASQLAPLNSVKTITTYTLVGSVIGAALILLLSMLMIVRERRREIGVLKALGAPDRSIIGQFISESTTFTVLGAVVGLVGGILLSSPIASALVSATSNSTTAAGGFVRGGPGGFRGGGSGFTPPSGGAGAFPSRSGLHFGGFSNTLTTLHTSVGWSTLAFCFLFAIVIAALGSSVATGTIVRIRPAEVLRSE